LAALTLIGFGGAGCSGGSDDGMTTSQKQTSDRLGEIAKRTGGDWSKTTSEDKDFLVNKMSYGNERSAQMLLMGAAGKIGGQSAGQRQTPQVPQGR
jgi:hypothetical protein